MMIEYMKIEAAAEYAGTTIQNLYKAIRNGSLRCRWFNRKKFTTKEWIDEYMKIKGCRQENLRINGKLCYDPLKGEMSVKMVADYLNTSPNAIYALLRDGYLKSYQKGNYHIIKRQDVDEMLHNRGYVRHIRKRKVA